ncbi:Kunitz type trypsin inhibitor / miraculin [Medicago truncatula]|uniref:Kunitz type trypsin inhibitor / miraculin n=2 Tax=Medicago truncatula TaxID=3880 RepID=A0A072UAS3_MEDTR|nr:Kunitz type trypsin inhibitor / miraculin [Medicago truncatula]
MFVYVLIIFLSQFLIVTSRSKFPCLSIIDCPDLRYHTLQNCIRGFCVYLE